MSLLSYEDLLSTAISLAFEASDYRPRRTNNLLEQLRTEPPRHVLARLIAECQEICAPHPSEIVGVRKPERQEEVRQMLTTVYV